MRMPSPRAVISLRGIGKRYRIYARARDRLLELVTQRPRHRVHQAVADIDLDLHPGESLGVIGPNGAGKSTLLKLVYGVLLPDTGRIQAEGRITGLLELGTGFNPELSGAENIRLNGLLLGMTLEEIGRERAAIVAFSELGSFIDAPVRTYSSGMAMRLGFAIAIHARPACFSVDEALAVGDAHFQQKCLRRMREFREQGGSILLVSHDLHSVVSLCDRALLLDRGRCIAEGKPQEVVNRYNRLIAGDDGAIETGAAPNPGSATGTDPHAGAGLVSAYGTGVARILAARFAGEQSGPNAVACGEHAVIRVRAEVREAMDAVTLGISIRDRLGQTAFGTNTNMLGMPLQLTPGQPQWFRFRFRVDLAPGDYTVTVALHRGDSHTEGCYDWRDFALSFRVAGFTARPFSGMFDLRPAFSVEDAESKHSEATR